MKEIPFLSVLLNGEEVGKLVLTSDGNCAFEYESAFLNNGFSLAPFYLPLEKKVFLAKPNPFQGNFGVFSDSLPDGWGNLLLDRYLKKQSIRSSQINQIQRLALIGKDGRGALEYQPSILMKEEFRYVDLEMLAMNARKILETEYDGEGLDILYQKGGTSGGARPKVFLKIDGEEWLIKFRSSYDSLKVGKIEYQHALMAKKCGIEMPKVKLFEGKYFGARRFDREQDRKIHTITAAGLLQADYRIPSLDYTTLFRACHLLTKNMNELIQLFRRMVFNILIKNKDDHAKNFSFQYINREWKLSPAYDLLPSDGFNGYHTTTINHNGNPTYADVWAIVEEFEIPKNQAKEIIQEMEETCRIRL